MLVRDPRPVLADLARTTRLGVRTLCTPAGLRGAGTEAVWSAAHLAPYPLGVLGEQGRRGGRVVHEIATLLAHLDEDGSTVTPGVSPLPTSSPAAPAAPASGSTSRSASTSA